MKISLTKNQTNFFCILAIKWKVEMDLFLCIHDSYIYPKSESQIPSSISLTTV